MYLKVYVSVPGSWDSYFKLFPFCLIENKTEQCRKCASCSFLPEQIKSPPPFRYSHFSTGWRLCSLCPFPSEFLHHLVQPGFLLPHRPRSKHSKLTPDLLLPQFSMSLVDNFPFATWWLCNPNPTRSYAISRRVTSIAPLVTVQWFAFLKPTRTLPRA